MRPVGPFSMAPVVLECLKQQFLTPWHMKIQAPALNSAFSLGALVLCRIKFRSHYLDMRYIHYREAAVAVSPFTGWSRVTHDCVHMQMELCMW